MFRKLVLAMGCVLLGSWLVVPDVGAQRGTPPPEVPPTNPPPAETPPDTAPPVTAPPDAAPPPAPDAPPALAPPEVPAVPAEEERPRVFAGVVTEPPAPAPVANPRPAPVRLPFTGAGGTALPLAGAALALGGLGIIAGQPGRPATGGATVPVTGTGQVRLLHQRDAAPTSSGPRRRGRHGRAPQPRLRRRG
jgi:hypothetical protein